MRKTSSMVGKLKIERLAVKEIYVLIIPKKRIPNPNIGILKVFPICTQWMRLTDKNNPSIDAKRFSTKRNYFAFHYTFLILLSWQEEHRLST
ncbi:hypothetical protein [Mariniradius saccharolyticus]|nr:hypothetical protein [Mariniradius saccharolyticus]